MRPDLEGAAGEARRLLTEGLSPRLSYHRVEHTADDVVPATLRLAELEGVEGHPRLLVLTAAWYHDLGYIVKTAGHEAVSIAMAHEILPGFGYTPADLDVIEELIEATKVPQVARSELAGLLADADLDTLGRPDVWDKNAALRSEMEANGAVHDDRSWLDDQIAFVRQHRYFTASARRLRDEGKARFLGDLLQLRAAAE